MHCRFDTRMFIRLLIFLFINLVLLNTSVGEAANFGIYPRTRLSLYQNMYSGEKEKSFAEAATGFGAGVSVFLDGKHFVPLSGLKISTVSGRQGFLDGTAKVTTSFNFYSVTTDLGLQIFPIERRTKGFNIYFVGMGVAGYNFIDLADSATLTSIPYSDQSFSAGYAAGIGSEWILNIAGQNHWAIYLEALFRNEQTTLLNKEFDLSNIMFSIGLGW